MRTYSQNFFCGFSIYKAEPFEVNIKQSYDDMFEDVLHEMALQWSSSGGIPNFKEAMRKNGEIRQGEDGALVLKGDGWLVTLYTPEYQAKHTAYIDAKDYEGLANFVARNRAKVWSN